MAKKIPMRMCVGCRQMKEKKEMIRVLRTQDGEFCIDTTGKKNGRGRIYLQKSAVPAGGRKKITDWNVRSNEYTKGNSCIIGKGDGTDCRMTKLCRPFPWPRRQGR